MSHWVMALQCPLLLSDSLFPGIFRNQQIRSRGVLVQNGHSLCVTWSICQCNIAVAETWRRIWGGRNNFFLGPRFLNDVFFGKNFWWPFLVIDLVFRIFPFFSQIFRVFTMINIVYYPFLTRKTPFFYSVHTFTRIRQHYFSKYWGDQCMGRPLPQIWGDRPQFL